MRRLPTFIHDSTIVAGGSLWLWMMMESLKPGMVSYYWNFTAHWTVFVALLLLASFLPRERRDDEHYLSSWSGWWIVTAFLASILMTAILFSQGVVAIVMGIITFIVSAALCRIAGSPVV